VSTPKHNASAVSAAVIRAGGIKAVAARALGVSRPTLDRYLACYASAREAYDEANETNIDIAEGKLLEQVRGGDSDQIRFYLRTKGRARGYGDHVALTGKDGTPLPGILIINGPQPPPEP